ncbi:MAG: C1 family peptidase [Planctomycetota bacterium]
MAKKKTGKKSPRRTNRTPSKANGGSPTSRQRTKEVKSSPPPAEIPRGPSGLLRPTLDRSGIRDPDAASFVDGGGIRDLDAIGRLGIDAAVKVQALHRSNRYPDGDMPGIDRVLNCVPSMGQQDDWGMEAAADANYVNNHISPEGAADLRNKSIWPIQDQLQTGACVGFAAAGVLWYHYHKAGLLGRGQPPSARFLWMANKETDHITDFPSTFLDSAGTQTKLVLKIARHYGCVTDHELSMFGDQQYSRLSVTDFYLRAAKLRIKAFFNLGAVFDDWRRWLDQVGPLLTRLVVDDSWRNATHNDGILQVYRGRRWGGHAVAIVGYNSDGFIIRNSWGAGWGKDGYAYSTLDYTAAAFTEAYGVVLD